MISFPMLEANMQTCPRARYLGSLPSTPAMIMASHWVLTEQTSGTAWTKASLVRLRLQRSRDMRKKGLLLRRLVYSFDLEWLI